MASSAYMYANAKETFADGAVIDWVNDAFKGVLVSSAYTPDYDTHEFLSSVTNTVGTAVAVSGKTLAKIGTGATAQYALRSSAVSFTGNLTARGMVLYKDTGSAATSRLLSYVLLDNAPADVSSSVGIDVTPDSTNGWIRVG
jgi:hypothetical protein